MANFILSEKQKPRVLAFLKEAYNSHRLDPRCSGESCKLLAEIRRKITELELELRGDQER